MAELDKRFFDMVFAEVGGGSPAEVQAVASVFLNRIDKQGYERALKGSSAYNHQSREYIKASTEKFNPFEKIIYERNKKIIGDLINQPGSRLPYTHFENVKAFGTPAWAQKATQYKDIGRQRFYLLNE